MLVYAGRAWDLQFLNGTAYAKQAAQNSADRKGCSYADRGGHRGDRNGMPLAYNTLTNVTDDLRLALIRRCAASRTS